MATRIFSVDRALEAHLQDREAPRPREGKTSDHTRARSLRPASRQAKTVTPDGPDGSGQAHPHHVRPRVARRGPPGGRGDGAGPRAGAGPHHRVVRHEVVCVAVMPIRDITWCSATSILPAHASRVTVGCEAAGTMEPHPSGWSRKREPTWRLPASRGSGARMAWEGQQK